MQRYLARMAAREYAAHPAMQQVIVKRIDGEIPSWKGPCPECDGTVHLFHGKPVECGQHVVMSLGAAVFVWSLKPAVDRAAYDHETE